MKLLLCFALFLTLAAMGKAEESTASVPAAEDDLGKKSPEVEEAAAWVLKHGGEVNVAIRTLPNRGRKMYAAKDFAPGEVMMKVPLSVSFTMYPKEGEELWSGAADQLYAEIKNPDSPLQFYWKTLPTREMVWSFYDIPESYLPLIQSESLERNIADLQAEKLNTAKDVEGMRYTLSLLETRTFSTTDGQGLLMLPVMDMADHMHACSHTYLHDDCEAPDGEEQECIVFYAGTHLKKGQEICIAYREHLSQDGSLLQYGFLQDGAVSDMLSRMDRHDFDPDDPWLEPPHGDFKPENPDDARAEISRLRQLEADLQARNEQLKDVIQPHPRDVGGRYLQLLWIWRVQRQAAIVREVTRLSEVLARLEAACSPRQ